MSLLQAVLSDPAQTIITYPPSTTDEPDAIQSKPNVFQALKKNWRQLLNILPGKFCESMINI